MPKETVRYPDALVAGVEAVVAEADAFESKSEFYRFASDFLLSVLDEDHEPTVLGYGDIVTDLEASSDATLAPRSEGEGTATGPFLDAYIQVRRHLLYDDVEAARAVVAERYDATAREALLLDEVIGGERRAASAGTTHARARETGRNASGAPENPSRAGGDRRAERGPDSRDATVDGSTAEGTPDRPRSGERRNAPAEAARETDGGQESGRDEEGA
jgi:Arc/MetJ-type ribon-helix-helix transcriptional regulator